MRVLVARDGQVIPGQEALFQKLVDKTKTELLKIDHWLREYVPSYVQEMDSNPPVDWDQEAREELFDSAQRLDMGEIYYVNLDGDEHESFSR